MSKRNYTNLCFNCRQNRAKSTIKTELHPKPILVLYIAGEVWENGQQCFRITVKCKGQFAVAVSAGRDLKKYTKSR